MTHQSFPHRERSHSRLLATAIAATWVAVLVLYVATAGVVAMGAPLFVLLAVAGLTLAAMAPTATRPAATSARVWLDAAWRAWLAGALGAVLLFARALASPSASIADISSRMAFAVSAVAWGLAVAGTLALRASRCTADDDAPFEAAFVPDSPSRLFGLVSLAILLLATTPPLTVNFGPQAMSAWGLVLYWPAALLVCGTAFLILSLARGPGRGQWLSPAVASAGTLGALVGGTTSLVGMSQQDIGTVTSGLQCILTSCFLGSLAMLIAVDSRFLARTDDRWRSEPMGFASTCARLLFPIVTALFLIVAFLLVVTPMTRRL